MKKFQNFILEAQAATYVNTEVTRSMLDKIKLTANKPFKNFGLVLKFTNHFHERMNDERNSPRVSTQELVNLLVKIVAEKGIRLKKYSKASISEFEVILIDKSRNLNIPTVLELLPNGFMEIRMKTVLRKKGFYSNDVRIEY